MRAALRLLHVLGLGWSGSSAVFEDLRGARDVVGLTDGGDGETCALSKRTNPRDLQRFFPEHHLTGTDVLQLLTGGRELGFGQHGRWAPDPAAREGASPSRRTSDVVVEHLHRHRKYGRANQHLLPWIAPESFLAVYARTFPEGRHPFTNADTRLLLLALLEESVPEASYGVLNNDPVLTMLTAEDLASPSIILVVTRRARAQLADHVNEQLLAKQLQVPTGRLLFQWLRSQLQLRRMTRRLIRRSRRGDVRACVMAIRFEDYVVDAELRRELRRTLGLDEYEDSVVDFARSAQNIHVTARLRIPIAVRLGCRLLDLLRPPTRLEALQGG